MNSRRFDMAKVAVLTQGLAPNNDHELAISNLLNISWTTKIFISVAFIRKAGVDKIQKELQAKNTMTEIFVGISNGITSKQALTKLLDIGIHPYVIDMGTQSSIFHPKVYAAIGQDSAAVILGSANLTASGLTDNIEISSLIELDLTIHDDSKYISSLIEPFYLLITEHPKNIFQIKTVTELDNLVDQGRLEDENIRKTAPITGSKNKNGQSIAIPTLFIHRRKAKIKKIPKTLITYPSIDGVAAPPKGLVWSSKELTKRDLNIFTNSNTNSTGSMYFKKGLLKYIDQRHFFKDIIFSNLTWTPDSEKSKQHLLRSTANFEIIINGISNGFFKLRLTHNSKTETKTYRQNNATTQIHWGEAKNIISKKELLGKHMSLYYLSKNNYQIEIT